MKTLGVIPARFASTRFPGKPLALVHQKPMIQWVFERAQHCKSIDTLIVATDDSKIAKAVKSFGGDVIMTSEDHINGTSRCAEVLHQQQLSFDIVLNIQGDEPYIHTQPLNDLIQCFEDQTIDISTVKKKIVRSGDLLSSDTVKVVTDKQNKALYFSRAPIPYLRGVSREDWLKSHEFYKHLGIYAYRSNVLQQLGELSPTVLEDVEKLEQLRWLEHGLSIQCIETKFESPSVDTPQDLEFVNKLKSPSEFQSLNN